MDPTIRLAIGFTVSLGLAVVFFVLFRLVR